MFSDQSQMPRLHFTLSREFRHQLNTPYALQDFKHGPKLPQANHEFLSDFEEDHSHKMAHQLPNNQSKGVIWITNLHKS